MTRALWLALAAAGVAGGAAMVAGGPAPRDGNEPGKVRIGVYDSRSIAVAWAASAHNPVSARMAEYKQAEAAGDTRKVAELKAWGEAQQRKLHFQGFGRVPVDDLLQPISKELAELAKRESLSAVAMACDYVGVNAEVIDITEELVDLYKPSDRVRKMALSVRDAKPVDLLTLADLPPSD